jgi:hypothetical protein
MLKWILSRLKERSTWGGIFTLATLAGAKIAPELRETIITAGTAAIGLVLALTADPKAVSTEPAQTITSPEPTAEQRATLDNP